VRSGSPRTGRSSSSASATSARRSRTTPASAAAASAWSRCSTPTRPDEVVAGIEVRPFDDLEGIVREHSVAIGVIATPALSAQDVADRMVACGITSILNFAPFPLNVPDQVDVRKVDLSIELQILAYHEQRKTGQGAPA
jgi:redox-sensing transcriptional repressor